MVFSLHSTAHVNRNALMLIVAFCVSVISLPVQSTEVYAGLSAVQLHRTTQLVNQLQWQQAIRKSANAHPLGVQTLSIELAERKKGTQTRHIKVFQYNYISQNSRLVVVDIDTGNIVKQQSISSVHLPLNEVEIDYARTLVENTHTLMDTINDEQQRRGLMQLADLSTLDVKASVFEPLSSTHTCQRERCALLSLFDKSNTVYATTFPFPILIRVGHSRHNGSRLRTRRSHSTLV